MLSSTEPGAASASLQLASPEPGYGRDLWRLAIVLGLFFFAFLGVRPLSNPDEGRYTEIPREMALTGDYITPRLNGVKYFEKPPLVYWLSAVTFEVVGVNEWSARFWCATFAVLGGLLTYAAGRALYGREAGLFSAIVLSLSLLYYALSRVILTDLVVAVLIAAALFSFVLGIREPAGSRRRLLFWAFYASMALATLTKGLIGVVLPCAVIAMWVIALNQWSRLRSGYWLSGVLLFFAIAAPWHILAAQANADFLNFYFVHEHFLRFTTQVHGRYQPWWFFVPVVIAGLFPWIVFAPQALKLNFVGGWRGRGKEAESWFLVIWLVLIVAFFSKSQSKLVPYVLPVFPAAALLIGRYLAARWGNGATRDVRIGLWVFAGLATALAIAITTAPIPSKYPELAATLRPWRFVLGPALVLGAMAVAWSNLRGTIRSGLFAMAVTCIAFFTSTNWVAGLADTRSTKALAAAIKPQLQPGDAVFCVGEYMQDFPVYLDRLVDVVDYEGELAFGIHAEPTRTASRFIDGSTFLRRWRETPTAYALMQKRAMPAWFADPTVPRKAVAETSRYMLFVNRNP